MQQCLWQSSQGCNNVYHQAIAYDYNYASKADFYAASNCWAKYTWCSSLTTADLYAWLNSNNTTCLWYTYLPSYRNTNQQHAFVAAKVCGSNLWAIDQDPNRNNLMSPYSYGPMLPTLFPLSQSYLWDGVLRPWKRYGLTNTIQRPLSERHTHVAGNQPNEQPNWTLVEPKGTYGINPNQSETGLHLSLDATILRNKWRMLVARGPF